MNDDHALHLRRANVACPMTGGAMTYDQAARHVVETEPAFAVTDATVRGVTYRVFQNAPPHLRALQQACREKMDNGTAEYLVFGDERWSYDAFCNETNRLARMLETRLNVRPGDRVALAMRNLPEMMMLMLAIPAIGGVTVFLNAWWTTEELDYALQDTEAKTVFADGLRVSRLRPLIADRGFRLIGVRDGDRVAPLSLSALLDGIGGADWPDVPIDTDDDFAIMYSSGTTSHPKGVVLTHRGAVNAIMTWAMQAAMAPLIEPPGPDAPEPPRLAALIVTPLFHVTATHPLFLLSMPAGAKLVVMEKWDAEHAVRLIRDEKITRFVGVPTQSAELMEAAARLDEPLPTLEVIGSGGAKRPPAQVTALARHFPSAKVATGWGMTETNAIGIGLIGAEYAARPDTAGRLYPPLQDLRIEAEDGSELPRGEVGEIVVKSPCNMREYLNKPEATAETLRDGWLHTGDLGRIEDDGTITIVDRKKNIIIRGGENIACLDVEAALHRHPDVAEACAFSVPDARLGETVGAAVALRSGATEDADGLRAFLAGHIAPFKVPQHLWFLPAPLPRGATDKLDRRAMRTACLTELTRNLPES